MPVRERKYSSDEALQRGDQFYAERVLPHVKDEDYGKFVSIDLDSGEWEMDADPMAPGTRLRERRPEAQILTTRVGYGYAIRIGGASLRRQA